MLPATACGWAREKGQSLGGKGGKRRISINAMAPGCRATLRLARNFGAMQKHGERVLSPPIAEENSERREGSASKCRGAPRSSLTSGSTRFATRDAPSWPSSSRCTSCNLCGGRMPPGTLFNRDQESMTAWSKGPLAAAPWQSGANSGVDGPGWGGLLRHGVIVGYARERLR